jgi:RNA polymerase sigma-70 factor (ECF subfamily)
VNGQLAVGCYIWDAERGDFEAGVIDVLTLRGDRVAEVTAFLGGERFPRFGLPERLPA